MKNQHLLLLSIALLFAMGQSIAQPVGLTANNSLLNPVLGFSYNNCVVDMNNDQLDDVVRPTDNGLYIDYQQPDGSFTQSFFGISFINLPSWSVCAGDLDNNGFNDLLFGDGSAVSFIKANATGTGYAEYPMPGFIFSQRSTMADIDNDGDLDAFVCHDVDQSHPYRNDGNGIMTLDQTLIVTADRPGNYAAIWTDYDNDGDNDLYITKCKGGSVPGDIDRTNLLYRNNGDGTYTEVGAAAGVDDNAQSWSTVFEDFDNDGDFDAFVVNHDAQNRFFLNNGDGTFTDIVGSTGINPTDLGAWENASGDFNNDGWVDIFSQLSAELHVNNADLTFTPQQLPVNGGGIGDLNNDGFLDVVQGGTIYFNNGNDNNWLKINTQGIQSNKNGIGARIELHGAWGKQIREVRSGQSFSPMSSLLTYFGIGQATSVDSIVVRWPSGMRTVLPNPTINTTITIPEADCLLPQSQITVSGDTQLCPGETVVLSAPAGFNYNWSNDAATQSITVGESGSYSAFLIDANGCVSFTNSVNVEVIQEIVPFITVTGETKFCEGGTVTLAYTGGANPVWSTGQTGGSIEVSASGTYSVSTDALCSNDPITSESVSVEVLGAAVPTVTGANIMPGDSVLLTAIGPNLEWYDAPTGGNLLGTGNSFQTPILNQTTTYYVEAHHDYPGLIEYGGKPNNSGPGGVPTSGSYNLFNVWEPFTLVSVVVYVPNTAPAGFRTIRLQDSNGTILEEKDFDLGVGTHQLTLNFQVPIGTDLSLRCVENNLFRNTSASTQFPYAIGTMGEITNDALGNEFYYYFYNWEVQKKSLECISDRATATVEVVSAGDETVRPASSVELSPNPASEEVLVRITGQASLLRLVDATGREVMRQPIAGNDNLNLSIGNLPAGIYLVKVETITGSLETRLVVMDGQ